ncbi:MAG TPA: hypothetical protein VE046_00930 [Steroidobacteraceae bacterium]|nr:hypothetical protein [Steroidobacteraceae bacterium]
MLGSAALSRADPAPAAGRPRIGLVLAGGGAKGGAHASGIPAAELEEFLQGIDWKTVVGSQGRRGLEPIEQKRAGATCSNDFEFGVNADGIIAPGGLVNTSNIEDLLRVSFATARLESDFSKLPIPFRVVATDMVSGKMVVLDQGDRATAMRASSARTS